MEFIDLKAQYARYKDAIDCRIQRVLDHGRFVLGPEIPELEAALAARAGAAHVVTVSSGTASLEIALRALGIGAGDEVITVPFTFISSAEAIALVGARPVFVDIEPATFNIDVGQVEAAVTPRTRAIIAVDLYGQMADYPRLMPIARKHGVRLIADAAQSFGAKQDGVPSGAAGDVSSTSFFPSKPLGAYGDGGALFTHDHQLAERFRAIRVHGSDRRDHHPWIGTNGRFDTIQAAILLAKLDHFDRELEARARIGARYSEMLDGIVTVPAVGPGNTHVWAVYTIRSDRRDAIARALAAEEIPTGIYYSECLHLQPVFEAFGYRRGAFPAAELAAQEVLSLPMHAFLSEADQDRIVEAIRSVA
jgi:UDP-2-acetamido-2-deoxy-ribo-hexuluronate aminotransferase